MDSRVQPHRLSDALINCPDTVTMLSLDCFDTLIWRNMHAPHDLFVDMVGQGISQQQRIYAERSARARALLNRNMAEVSIEEIYTQLMPKASLLARGAAMDNELMVEVRHCYAFEPVVALMRDAKALGMEIAIVSDTYLDCIQLGQLIRAVAGNAVYSMINHIFCSSSYGMSKGEGLFHHVLKDTEKSPEQILHIGDNRNADLVAPQALGIHARHFVQFDAQTVQRLRLEAVSSAMIHSHDRAPNIPYQPHRAALAYNLPQITDPAIAMGHASIGPILYGFVQWVMNEALALEARNGGQVHLLFLMRDGYLPKLAFDTLMLDANIATHAVEISRFTATACSMNCPKSVEHVLEAGIAHGNLEILAKQLLLTRAEREALFRKLPNLGRIAAFVTAIRAPVMMAKIIARGQAFARRLVRHIRAQVPVAAGDTLMFVDLGYNGSVQNAVESVLRGLMDVEIAGRYLLLRENDLAGNDKAGLIGRDDYSAHVLDALCKNVSVLEQICTASQGSVIDYSSAGDPVRADIGIKARQNIVRDALQQGCLQFIKDRSAYFVRPPISDDNVAARRCAAASMARLFFLPMEQELKVLSQFEHDVNMGAGNMVRLFAPEIAEQGLRERGMFYMKHADRMYLPAELHGQGLPLSLTNMVSSCFGLPLHYVDFCDATLEMPILVANGRDVVLDKAPAYPTHNGYHIAAIPVGEFRYAIGVQFGKLYDLVQIESARFIAVSEFISDKAPIAAPITATISFEAMEALHSDIYHCQDATAFMMVPPPAQTANVAMMLVVTFRPIAKRTVTALLDNACDVAVAGKAS